MYSYSHEPFTNFTEEKNIQEFNDALGFVQSQLGKHYPVIIGGKSITTEEKMQSINPANKEEVIGSVSMANQELAEKAMQAALTAFESWKKWKPEHRAHILFRAAAMLRRRKHEFSSYLVKEAGKPWEKPMQIRQRPLIFLSFTLDKCY